VKLEMINEEDKRNPYIGVAFVIKWVRRLKINKLFDKLFGKRVKQAFFSHGDCFESILLACFTNTKCIEDVDAVREYFDVKMLNPEFNRKKNRPKHLVNIASADRTADLCREKYVSDSEIIYSKETKNHQRKLNHKKRKTIIHEINYNPKLNWFLAKVFKTLYKFIIGNEVIAWDIDSVFIDHKKSDATKVFYQGKTHYGYYPLVSALNGLPIYVENRSGRTTSSFGYIPAMKRTWRQLEIIGVKPKYFRSDAAGYQSKVIKECEDYGLTYLISARASKFRNIVVNWIGQSEIINEHGNTEQKQVGEIPHFWAFGKYKCKVLVVKGRSTTYIITNDFYLDPVEAVKLYFQRFHNIEQLFRDLKQDFRFKNLPFSNLKQNTVHLILSSVFYLIFRAFKNFILKQGFYRRKLLKQDMKFATFFKNFIKADGYIKDNKLQIFDGGSFLRFARLLNY
jgi:hypothetical protein